MGDHTIVNLREVEDQAVGGGLSPDLEARFPGSALGLKQSGVSYQRMAPGFRTPWGHRHDRQEEVYVIVGGDGRIRLDDEVLDVKEWDAVRIGPETMRALEAGPDGLELLAFGAPKAADESAGDDVTDMTPGWWSD